MCGIAGILRGGGRPVEEATLTAMQAALAHRGPDQAGAVTDGPLGLAATRLRILDLSDAADQPLVADGAALTFNGEIYNWRSLARDLRREGLDVDDRSDTEVLFRALRHWGVAATLPRLRGMFALAYADLPTSRVWLARDRLGIKPLVWTEHAGDVAWASEAKALTPVRPLQPDPVQAVFAVAGRIERSPELTAFRGVGQIPAGHMLELVAGDPPRLTAWTTLTDLVDRELHDELAGLTRDALVGRLDLLLAEATTAMTSSDAPLGLFLSGGVDSSLLAALTGPAGPRAFTADIGGRRSEAAAARAVAEHLGRELVPVAFPRDGVLEDWALATWHAEAPVVTHVNGLPFRRLAVAAQERGVKAVLTGEGADELFAGYAEMATGAFTRAAGAPRRLLHRTGGHLPGPVGAALARRGSSQADFLVDLAGGFHKERLLRRAVDAFAFLPAPQAARQATTLPWLGEHLPTLLHRNDALGMAASVEARFPYLDEEVVRFGVNLPLRAKVALQPRVGDHRHPFLLDKAVLRHAAARHLPASVAYRDKLGFPVHGYDTVRTSPAFWADGYVMELLGLSRGAVDHLLDAVDPYLTAKLAAVEVFGRLFARGAPVDEVRGHVRSSTHCTDQ